MILSLVSSPDSMALVSIRLTGLSFNEPPGFIHSALANREKLDLGVRKLTSIRGVFPIRSSKPVLVIDSVSIILY